MSAGALQIPSTAPQANGATSRRGGGAGFISEFLRRSALGRIGFVLTLFLVLVALLAPWIAPHSPAAQDLPSRLCGPCAAHWMGTDELGRDIFSRVIYGARISMTVGVSSFPAQASSDFVLGALAGYFGGWLGPHHQRRAHQRVSFVSRNFIRHRVRRVLRSRPGQSCSRARSSPAGPDTRVWPAHKF